MGCQKITISEETKLINFVVNVLKKEKILKKAIIEYQINISSEIECQPDFFAYLINEPDFNNYILLEFKQRRTLDDLENIKKQFNRYLMVNQAHLDSSKIPVIDGIPIFINYIFYNTRKDLIQHIANSLDFNEDSALIYYYITKKTINRNIKYFKEPNSSENHAINDFFIRYSENNEFWENLLIPFTINDLVGIKGEGGSASNAKVNPKISFQIILSNICTFILQRRIQEKPGEFKTDDFMEFLFSNVSGLIYFDEKNKKSIEKKLTLFLNYTAKISEEEKFIFFERRAGSNNKYLITIRKTENILDRINSIEKKLYREMYFQIWQKSLEDFFE